jgi:hypothetical protein
LALATATVRLSGSIGALHAAHLALSPARAAGTRFGFEHDEHFTIIYVEAR